MLSKVCPSVTVHDSTVTEPPSERSTRSTITENQSVGRARIDTVAETVTPAPPVSGLRSAVQRPLVSPLSAVKYSLSLSVSRWAIAISVASAGSGWLGRTVTLRCVGFEVPRGTHDTSGDVPLAETGRVPPPRHRIG
jgi:hypothetical protein